MARPADELVSHHMGQMAALYPGADLTGALSDYSSALSAITMLDGVKRTLSHRSLVTALNKVISFVGIFGMNMATTMDKLNIFYRKGTDDYVSLLLSMPPYGSFTAFTYIVEDGKAVYVVSYAKTPDGMPTLDLADEKLPPNPETMAVIQAHMAHVKDGDLAAMAADYAPGAVILTNLSTAPLIGESGIERYCAVLKDHAQAQITALTGDDTEFQIRDTVGEVGCLALKMRISGTACINTFRIQNGKIVFESAMFEGERAWI